MKSNRTTSKKSQEIRKAVPGSGKPEAGGMFNKENQASRMVEIRNRIKVRRDRMARQRQG